MKILLSLVLVFISFQITLLAQSDHISGVPEGFATLNGGVSGGKGGEIVTVTNTEMLLEYLDNTKAFILLIDGTIEISSEISCRGDKTIVGLGTNSRIKGGGLAWNTKKNVIVQNLIFEGSGDDMLKINNKCENIWIDHCTIRDSETGISDGVDGGLDITRASKNITVSYCHFYNHDKNMLIGHSDGNTEDTSITVSIHHCFFDGTIQRNPRVRYATVHCYNNYYLGNSTYGIASACDAKVLVENCFFKNVASPIIVGVPGYSPAGYLVHRGCEFINCGTPQSNEIDMDFTKFYRYKLDNTEITANIDTTYAGCGKPYRSTANTVENLNVITNTLYIDNQQIHFTAVNTTPAEICLFDLNGKKVAEPFRGWVKRGVENRIELNNIQHSGIYIVQFKAGGQVISKRVIISD